MLDTVLVYSETPRNALELITAARSLAQKVTALVVGSDADAESVAATGIEKVIRIPEDDSVPTEAYAQVVAKTAADGGYEAVLITATAFGRAVAGMVAQMLDAPCASDCRSIEAIDGGVAIVRTVYGGKADSYEQAVAPVIVATVPPLTFEPAAAQGDATPVEEAPAPAGYPVKITGVVPKEKDAVDITAANALVLIGRGIAKEEDLQLAQDLADALGGVVACTRPIAEDYHWFPTERYVGMSGQTVKPDLLMCVGVSGQIQCLSGASDSKVIVGINTDENAPMAASSDYFVNASLYDVVPEIVKAVKER